MERGMRGCLVICCVYTCVRSVCTEYSTPRTEEYTSYVQSVASSHRTGAVLRLWRSGGGGVRLTVATPPRPLTAPPPC